MPQRVRGAAGLDNNPRLAIYGIPARLPTVRGFLRQKP